jgi:hypothetical protein
MRKVERTAGPRTVEAPVQGTRGPEREPMYERPFSVPFLRVGGEEASQ